MILIENFKFLSLFYNKSLNIKSYSILFVFIILTSFLLFKNLSYFFYQIPNLKTSIQINQDQLKKSAIQNEFNYKHSLNRTNQVIFNPFLATITSNSEIMNIDIKKTKLKAVLLTETDKTALITYNNKSFIILEDQIISKQNLIVSKISRGRVTLYETNKNNGKKTILKLF